ncbi:MAG TPA: hypothetical protein EYN06_03085 [Myxococcales bacterium]|nr:hypothetical protein [Myxococcales bacterium]HIN85440.1 hypothetical protein [Myxococcales bacterium]
MRAFTITLITFFSLSTLAPTAMAKDPYESINPITGMKRLTTYESANSFSKTSSKSSSLVEILYVGGTELQLNDGKKIRRISQGGMASNHFSWEGSKGRTFVINSPANSQGLLKGTILFGNSKIGIFYLSNYKVAAAPAAGRWTGVLAFPGGAQLDVALQVSGVSHKFAGDCQAWLPTRVDIPGSSYSEGYVSICGKGNHNHQMNFFYWDRKNSDVWFFTIEGAVFYESTVFQGSAWGFSLYGTGNSEGKFYLTRPTSFAL